MGCLDRVIPSRVQTFVDAIISMLTSSLQIIVGEELHKKYNTRFWQRHQAAWDSIFEIGEPSSCSFNADVQQPVTKRATFAPVQDVPYSPLYATLFAPFDIQ